jgi:hypothetical protein
VAILLVDRDGGAKIAGNKDPGYVGGSSDARLDTKFRAAKVKGLTVPGLPSRKNLRRSFGR